MTIATLLGGLGLFVLAVSMITDGLKLAGGDALQQILHRSTATTLRGVGSRVLVTGIVRSSSAVTVATIGLVNAGFLTLPQALGVVYAANIGTTRTSWLVAAVGFDSKMETLALSLVGMGMLAGLLGASRRSSALGQAVAGFGLLSIGSDVLRDGYQGLAGHVDMAAFAPQGTIGLLPPGAAPRVPSRRPRHPLRISRVALGGGPRRRALRAHPGRQGEAEGARQLPSP